ncbi:MAG: type II secretion system protein GspF, partial [Deltaproteobacteria bacterium]|nr:type II secretion system protein GspF [Deltaproteobacteria bacterium]
MAVFEYDGLDGKGKSVRGIVDAEGVRAARAKLKRQGVFATDVRESRRASEGTAGGAGPLFGGGVRVTELALLTRQLTTLLGAGLPLVAALGALLEQVESDRVSRVFSQVKEGVNEGKAFHEVLAEHPRSFPEIYRNMVAAGEASGTLPLVLGRLADFLESSLAFRRKTQAALVYPTLMGVLGTGILWFLLVSVVPKVTKVFDDLHRVLPAPTRVLLAVSDILRNQGWLALVVLFVAVVGLRRYAATPGGRLQLDGLLLKIPAVGRFVRLVAVSRFTRTLGTLLASGVP